MPPVSPCAPWRCSGTSTPTGLVRAATTRRVVHRSMTLMASSITPTGSTICSSPPPWEGENYEPRNPMESEILFEIFLFQTQPLQDAYSQRRLCYQPVAFAVLLLSLLSPLPEFVAAQSASALPLAFVLFRL